MRNTTNKEKVLNKLREICLSQKNNGKIEGITTEFLATSLRLQRPNVSCILNELCEENEVRKIKGKPVLYYVDTFAPVERKLIDSSSFDLLIGKETSLKGCVQKAKAAMLYPPRGLHSLLLGPTGVGKTMFAELMFKFAMENKIYSKEAPFVSFNCADYANNPQLLYSYLFGAKKGAYTGSTEDRAGIVEKARNGFLFLDEVHRLPPEGQEMLFTLIDKGTYRPLGGIEDITNVNVLIICATTENEDSTLLSTFKRRIPMIISLPSLKERSLEERLNLICEFFKTEAGRTGREIVISSDVMKNFVLYHCAGNIGQLKSDIQLTCANAFLRCITFENDRIQLELTDLPDYIKKGIIQYKQFKSQLDNLISQNTTYSFTAGYVEKQNEICKDSLPKDFYENIENRILELKRRNVSESDINLIMSIDIDNYFKTFIHKMGHDIHKKEMSGIVDEKVIPLIETFLEFAEKRLNKLFTQRIFFSLCLHVDSVLRRIKDGQPIVNYMLNDIIEKYPEEYATSLYFAELVEREFHIKIPADEIGYISMFISEGYFNDHECSNNPVVLIAMHGSSTASSMADVVNKLIGADNVYAYDMHLEKTSTEVYEELKDLIVQIDRGGGVLLLVDMGSISILSEVISNETKIKIRVIDMATTILAIECSRKAMVENDIDTIWSQVSTYGGDLIHYNQNAFRTIEPGKDNVIFTICITGEGSAIKLKHLIEEHIFINANDIQIIPISISDKKEMELKINKLSKNKNIIAVVGTVNPELHGIPFVSATELILEKNYDRLKQLISISEGAANEMPSQQRQMLRNVIDTLTNEIEGYDVKSLEPALVYFMDEIGRSFGHKLSFDSSIGLIMHLCFAIEKSIKGQVPPKFKYKDQIIKNYKRELLIIKDCLKPIELQMNIIFSDDEISAIFFFLEGFALDEPHESNKPFE